MTLGYLIRKEFKQFFRNPFLPKLVIAFPIVIMLVIPWIVNMDIKNIRLTVVDKDGSSTSGKLIRTLGASEYFILEDVTGSYPEALRQLEKGRTDAVVEIPGYFEQGLVSEGRAQVQISLNAVNQIKGSLGSNYLNAVCADFFAENFAPVSVSPVPAPRVSISVQNKFNPYMDYKNFMIPAYMVIVIILLGGFLPALNIVGEKEKGTIEQINITPVRKTTFIFAKLIPYWIMGLIVLFPPFHIRTFRIWSNSFQLFRHHAAGHVRHVLLHTGFHADERTAHPHILHAPVGAGHHLAEPSEILH